MKKTELTTILGLAIGFAAIMGAMHFKHLSYGIFINPAAICVILVGTVGSVLQAFPGRDLKKLGKLFGVLFSADDPNRVVESARSIVEMAELSRKEGFIALESKIAELSDPFMQRGVSLIVDGVKGDYISDLLSAELDEMQERHAINASIFSQACAYAPTLGVLGAVFGLIAALSHIDDTEMMAEAVAAAFLATVLGIFTGYVLWGPFANKLKTKSKHEVSEKKLILEGLLSLQEGENPQMIKEKLKSLLPAEQQALLDPVKE